MFHRMNSLYLRLSTLIIKLLEVKTSLEESITTSSQRTTVVIEEAIKSHTHELIVAPLVVKLQEQLNNAHSLKEQVKSMTTRMSIYLIFNHDSPLPCLLN